ncbi:MAG: hypothetical protein ACRC2H_00860 [Silanimonas sp.]
MAVTYPNAVKIARMNAVTTAAGTTAVLEIGTAGMATVLATIALGNPIAGAATGAGVLTLSGFPRSDTSADATGTAAAARIRTATGGTDIITGLTVGLSGSDINLDSLSITAGQTVTINSAVFTHAA